MTELTDDDVNYDQLTVQFVRHISSNNLQDFFTCQKNGVMEDFSVLLL